MLAHTLPTDDAAKEPRRVLVAEDDAGIRAMLCAALSGDGFEVLAVGNGVELLDRLQRGWRDRRPPDLVVVDERLPGLSALSVLSDLRFRHRPTPFILITAYGTPELRARARALGAVAVFDKPFDLDDLRTAVLNAPRRA